jgi:hypothetical protein
MRYGALVIAACVFCWPAAVTAQNYRTTASQAESVIRPAPTDMWRNYVTVPDGPCGYPMAVQADCYNGCGGGGCCCFRPLVFLHRVGRMLDCLLPCNLCCRGCGGGGCGGCGGCGLFHGCILGGRTWGHCGMCCGGPAGPYGGGPYGGGQYGGGAGGGCGCVNPCGSAFAPTQGGHCMGCSSVVPGGGETIIENQVLPTPTATPLSPEVRSTRTYRTQPAQYQKPTSSSSPRQSVLRRTSAEEELPEPRQLMIDYPSAKPIVRSQSPDSSADLVIPRNPLRR